MSLCVTGYAMSIVEFPVYRTKINQPQTDCLLSCTIQIYHYLLKSLLRHYVINPVSTSCGDVENGR